MAAVAGLGGLPLQTGYASGSLGSAQVRERVTVQHALEGVLGQLVQLDQVIAAAEARLQMALAPARPVPSSGVNADDSSSALVKALAHIQGQLITATNRLNDLMDRVEL